LLPVVDSVQQGVVAIEGNDEIEYGVSNKKRLS